MLAVSSHITGIEYPYDIRQSAVRAHDGIPKLTYDDSGDDAGKIDYCLEEILSFDHSSENKVCHKEAQWNLSEYRNECNPQVVLQSKPEIAVFEHFCVVFEADDVYAPLLRSEQWSTLIVRHTEIEPENSRESHDKDVNQEARENKGPVGHLFLSPSVKTPYGSHLLFSFLHIFPILFLFSPYFVCVPLIL